MLLKCYYLQIEDGRIKFPDFESKVKSLKLSSVETFF